VGLQPPKCAGSAALLRCCCAAAAVQLACLLRAPFLQSAFRTIGVAKVKPKTSPWRLANSYLFKMCISLRRERHFASTPSLSPRNIAILTRGKNSDFACEVCMFHIFMSLSCFIFKSFERLKHEMLVFIVFFTFPVSSFQHCSFQHFRFV
jgi:hypothetical protein